MIDFLFRLQFRDRCEISIRMDEIVVVTGVTTCVCVSTTIRGGVEHNYRMILVEDATAEIQREMHDAELKTMERLFADIKSADDVIEMLEEIA